MNNFELYSLAKSMRVSDNLVNTSGFDSPIFKVGDTITIIGSAIGGKVPYTYDFYIKRGTAVNWSRREPDQDDNVINLRPTSATSYQIKIDVTDSDGEIVSKIVSFSVVSASSTASTTNLQDTFIPNIALTVDGGYSE